MAPGDARGPFLYLASANRYTYNVSRYRSSILRTRALAVHFPGRTDYDATSASSPTSGTRVTRT